MLVIVVVRTGPRLVLLMINVKSWLSTVRQCLSLDCPQSGSPRPVRQPAVLSV